MPLRYFASRSAPYDRPQGIPILNRDSPQAQGLLGWWPTTEGGGNRLHDFSGRAEDAVFGAGGNPLWDVQSDHGRILSFPGADDLAETASAGWWPNPTKYTVSCWMLATTYENDSALWALRDGANTGLADLLLCYPAELTNNRIRFFGSAVFVNNANLADGVPHQIVYLTNSANDLLYIDGIQRHIEVSSTPKGPLTNFTMGAWRPTEQDFNGKGWDFRIWDRALSAAEIWSLYDPATRWDLYWQPRIMVPGFVADNFQIARPFADISLGGWTPEVAGSPSFAGSPTELWPMIDEATADDSDFIHSGPAPSSDACEVRLEALGDPLSSANHIVRYRYAKNVDIDERVDLTVALMEGAVERASWTHTDISATLATAEQTLTAEQADAISSYGNLRLRFTAEQP